MVNSTVLEMLQSIKKVTSSLLIATTIECKYSLEKVTSSPSSDLKDQKMVSSRILEE